MFDEKEWKRINEKQTEMVSPTKPENSLTRSKSIKGDTGAIARRLKLALKLVKNQTDVESEDLVEVADSLYYIILILKKGAK